ncbi:hypothetical protein EVAR_41793_1 [Eumeta japonica]|uniref:Uncharacterized protein n=1 Tax=Eumeta variegata TaxID=151549 RepID=A0A4C1VXE8_EUMVA|nr:hypothetical protein EVAR_41793_1 [Eumeta japonica]
MLTDEFKERRPKSVAVPENIDAVRKLIISGNFDLQNKPRRRPETLVDYEELKVIVETDPSQTKSELAAGFDSQKRSSQSSNPEEAAESCPKRKLTYKKVLGGPVRGEVGAPPAEFTGTNEKFSVKIVGLRERFNFVVASISASLSGGGAKAYYLGTYEIMTESLQRARAVRYTNTPSAVSRARAARAAPEITFMAAAPHDELRPRRRSAEVKDQNLGRSLSRDASRAELGIAATNQIEIGHSLSHVRACALRRGATTLQNII